MPVYQGKIEKETFICVADDLHDALQMMEEEGDRRGLQGGVSQIKEVDAKVIGISELGAAQSRLFPNKES